MGKSIVVTSSSGLEAVLSDRNTSAPEAGELYEIAFNRLSELPTVLYIWRGGYIKDPEVMKRKYSYQEREMSNEGS